MKKIAALAITLLSACGSSSNTRPDSPVSSPLPRPTPSPSVTPAKPDPAQRYRYMPAWLSSEWSVNTSFVGDGEPGNYGILRGQEPIADSLFHYWEAMRASWSKTIVHGVVPESYLKSVPSGFDSILWIDKTNGKVGGFEKLRPVLGVLLERCPSLADSRFQAPLSVVWATENETERAGQFWHTWLKLRYENGVRIDANTNMRPTLLIRAEYTKVFPNGSSDGYSYPLQTFREKTGGKSYADGGYTWKSIDETFAHEYGHFLVQAWAMNSGRSNIQSAWFAEGFAELFRLACWGGPHDNPEWVQAAIKNNIRENQPPFASREKTYRDFGHRITRGGEYVLNSLDDLITWESYKGRFDSDRFFQAMIKTLDSLEGKVIREYPVISPDEGPLTESAPWAASAADLAFPAIKADAPAMLTRQEFVAKFCDFYECGEMRYLLRADAEGLTKDEW